MGSSSVYTDSGIPSNVTLNNDMLYAAYLRRKKGSKEKALANAIEGASNDYRNRLNLKPIDEILDCAKGMGLTDAQIKGIRDSLPTQEGLEALLTEFSAAATEGGSVDSEKANAVKARIEEYLATIPTAASISGKIISMLPGTEDSLISFMNGQIESQANEREIKLTKLGKTGKEILAGFKKTNTEDIKLFVTQNKDKLSDICAAKDLIAAFKAALAKKISNLMETLDAEKANRYERTLNKWVSEMEVLIACAKDMGLTTEDLKDIIKLVNDKKKEFKGLFDAYVKASTADAAAGKPSDASKDLASKIETLLKELPAPTSEGKKLVVLLADKLKANFAKAIDAAVANASPKKKPAQDVVDAFKSGQMKLLEDLLKKYTDPDKKDADICQLKEDIKALKVKMNTAAKALISKINELNDQFQKAQSDSWKKLSECISNLGFASVVTEASIASVKADEQSKMSDLLGNFIKAACENGIDSREAKNMLSQLTSFFGGIHDSRMAAVAAILKKNVQEEFRKRLYVEGTDTITVDPSDTFRSGLVSDYRAREQGRFDLLYKTFSAEVDKSLCSAEAKDASAGLAKILSTMKDSADRLRSKLKADAYIRLVSFLWHDFERETYSDMLADVLKGVEDKDKLEFYNSLWKKFSALVGRDVKDPAVRKKLTEAAGLLNTGAKYIGLGYKFYALQDDTGKEKYKLESDTLPNDPKVMEIWRKTEEFIGGVRAAAIEYARTHRGNK